MHRSFSLVSRGAKFDNITVERFADRDDIQGKRTSVTKTDYVERHNFTSRSHADQKEVSGALAQIPQHKHDGLHDRKVKVQSARASANTSRSTRYVERSYSSCYFILIVSCFIWVGALDSSDAILSYYVTSLESH